ncbi:VWA domain-containing protein [Candidatus Halobeggiatoa sp. HSG11]|nr:VWA domain-containing protein [Candidatus Halobeggiatoa sp. HSG11]
MNFSDFEFANPIWLFALIVPVVVGILIWVLKIRLHYYKRIQNFADSHLLPHLLINSGTTSTVNSKKYIWWTAIWLLGILALAGPRWDYEEQEVWRQNANLMILLDLSESMRVTDLPHSRLEQALQDIEELLDKDKNIYIGLLVFAGIPHLVAPLTDDYQTLRHLLYELDIGLLPVQGSRLALAIENSVNWLKGQTMNAVPHLLLISDGDFDEQDFKDSLQLVQKGNFHLHSLGVGTTQGDVIPMKDGNWQKDTNGEVVISHLNEDYLRKLAVTGHGIYRKADYRNLDTQAILAAIDDSISIAAQDKALQKLWHERFYILVGLMLIFILPWFRKIN